MTTSEMLSVRQAAEQLGLSVACLRAWIATRKIPFVRLGRAIRIHRSALAELIERGTVPAREGRNGR
jgi:excisionase family DNA binding protein